MAGALELAFTGSDLGKKLRGLDRAGMARSARGAKWTEEGLKGLRDLDADFMEQINQGGLSRDVNRGFDLARGALSDNFVRAGRSLRASLEQQRLAGGGFLSQDAIAEMTTEADARRSEGFFTASNQLATDKAMLQQKTTQELYDQVLKIRDTIRETGLTQEQMGIMMRLQTAALKLERNKAIANSATSWIGGFGG